MAQLVAQLICNHQVGGSNPSAGTIKKAGFIPAFFIAVFFRNILILKILDVFVVNKIVLFFLLCCIINTSCLNIAEYFCFEKNY